MINRIITFKHRKDLRIMKIQRIPKQKKIGFRTIPHNVHSFLFSRPHLGSKASLTIKQRKDLRQSFNLIIKNH